MKRLLALHFCLAVIPWNVPQVRADDGDISDANIQPNTIISIDASGSTCDHRGHGHDLDDLSRGGNDQPAAPKQPDVAPQLHSAGAVLA